MMDKFVIRKSKFEQQFSSGSNEMNIEDNAQNCLKQPRIEINLEDLPADPGLRPKISHYHPNDRDKIRRYYLQKGPCQPCHHDFPKRKFGNKFRNFCSSWFNKFGNWLEYSIAKDAAYCLCCYLFRLDVEKQSGGDTFITNGFTNWSKEDRFHLHIVGLNSMHNNAWRRCQDLMNQSQHNEATISEQSDKVHDIHQTLLIASIDCVRFLLKQELAFCGHDELEDFSDQDIFVKLLELLAGYNETINDCILQNASEYNRSIDPEISKDIISAAAIESTNAILNDLGDEYFAIIVDVSCDISNKEQMAVVLRYVNKKGSVVERFLGIVHASNFTALSLKGGIESLFSRYGLNISSIRGQAYNGASDMLGEFNDLKGLILKENPSALYVHCFAYQLQHTLVFVAKNHMQVACFFKLVASLLNVVEGSCKQHDILREEQVFKVKEAFKSAEILGGWDMNQEIGLKKSGDICWSSHYETLTNLILMYSSVIDVLEIIMEDGLDVSQRGEANRLLGALQTFDFAFSLHLMKNVLEITNKLSQALQRKDQDIINAMKLVNTSKQRLRILRDSGWEFLLDEVSLFCTTHDIDIPNMEDMFLSKGQSRCRVQEITNLHHYCVDLFYTVVDMQLQELNDRFNETNTELLICLACLIPDNSFSAFDKQRLVQFAKFYPHDFSPIDLMFLDNQLETYILDMQSSDKFSNLKGIGSLAEKLVETRNDCVYPLVYLLVKLALTLPVATSTVERACSAMRIVKNRLRNEIGDTWINDCLVTYIEKDVFDSIDNELIIQRLQHMKLRRGQL